MITTYQRLRNCFPAKIDTVPDHVDHCLRNNITILKSDANGRIYENILSIRQQVYGQDRESAIDESDASSDLYCAYVDGIPCGTMRATQANRTKLDCEDFYPTRLIEDFRHCVTSASGFAILPTLNRSLNLASVLIDSVNMDQTQAGYRIDIINAHERAVRYYQRLGYRVVKDSFFVHPRWSTPSYVFIRCIDPKNERAIKYGYEVSDLVTYEDLSRYVSFVHFDKRPRRSAELAIA